MARACPSLAWQLPWALVAGLAQAASLAWPWGGEPLWWLQLASMAMLAWLLRPGADRAVAWHRAALLGGVFATAWLAGTFWWLFISMHRYGALPAPLAAAAVLVLAAFLASYYAAAMGLFCLLAPLHRAGAALLFGACWLLAELARGSLWTGFPWGAGGYAHADGPLRVLARYVGVYGIGAVAALLALLCVQWRRADLRHWPMWLLLLAGAAALALAAVQRTCAIDLCDTPPPWRRDPTLSVELLQGNIAQDEKFRQGSGVALALQWYGQALRTARAQLVVAPETALPLLPQQLMPGYLEGLARHYAQGPQAALLGIPWGDQATGYTNSVLGLSPATGAVPYRYDKHHLVPFGEFVPPFFKWFTARMQIPLGNFNRAGVGQASFAWAGQRLAPNICYEDLFGEELGARFIDPAQAPTVFVNLSNIGWFGNTIAIDQHLQISRMRALEFERPMVRATNTGATAIIDHRGQVTHQLARHTRGVLRGQVHGRGLDAHSGWAITPYAWWVARWGLWPLWALGALALALAWAMRAQRMRRARGA
ncbi:apolipoprotein N-acyltransferase [Verminephrobacter eiseniae]|uniref:apolipoprotein N-acyltransferase n=1 Tax=Verminephrobacter eiseniae TaxID=364317 RepID=UPI002237037B|nr:apolipoprotein N-acyltransferase [Verminephrobacter eiseniae]MCW5263430.1 apolipoprotein N-acyltransferase [Verminephrobacter eiseniae]